MQVSVTGRRSAAEMAVVLAAAAADSDNEEAHREGDAVFQLAQDALDVLADKALTGLVVDESAAAPIGIIAATLHVAVVLNEVK